MTNSHHGEQDQERGAKAPDQSSTAETFSAQIPYDAGTAWAEARTRVAVGRSVNVSGKLIFSEPVRIEGRFRGEVRSVELVVISETGMVEGKVTAPRLLIMGELRGDVTGCDRIVLGTRAKVFGNIEARNLTVREGAYLDATVRMTGIPEQK